MAGKSQAVAVQSYIDPIRRALSCVTKSVIQVSGGYSAVNNPHVLTLGVEPIPLSPKGKIQLSAEQHYEIVRSQGTRGPWKVHTLAYVYVLFDRRKPIINYHWHPRTSDIRFPHLHHPESPKIHFPTRRIAIEEVIRLAIREFGVEPLKKTWEKILSETQGNFEAWKAWH